MNRRIAIVLGALVVTAVLVLGVFPTRAYLDQRSQLNRARERLTVLNGESERLEERIALLGTDAEIERLARENYNLVRPGEEAYAVLPPPPPMPELPDTWPFDRLRGVLQGLG